jgi:hypothetical protein
MAVEVMVAAVMDLAAAVAVSAEVEHSSEVVADTSQVVVTDTFT